MKNNKDINIEEILKENEKRMEIAKELIGSNDEYTQKASSNKKMSNLLGERLSKKKNFPPC